MEEVTAYRSLDNALFEDKNCCLFNDLKIEVTKHVKTIIDNDKEDENEETFTGPEDIADLVCVVISTFSRSSDLITQIMKEKDNATNK